MKPLDSRIHSGIRHDGILAAWLGFSSLILYVRTLAPGLLFGDSAEFQTIAYTLGIGHPTGYSVYVLLAKLFTLLPVGDIAYRVNLFSASCAALTVALVYMLIRKLGGGILPAIYGALALALVPLFWKHASLAEIYTPAAACLAFILFAIVQWRQTKLPRWLFFAGLFGGLSLGIHTTVMLSVISTLLYLVLSARHRRDWSQAILGTICGIVIFLLSFLLLDFLNSPAGYYNTVVRPSLSIWNMTSVDFDSPLERFTFLYFPPQFKGQFFNIPIKEVPSRLEDFTAQVSWNLWPAVFGSIALFFHRKGSPSRWQEAIFLILTAITFLVFAATYNVYDFNVYYIPAIVVLAILIGLGINAILKIFALIPKLPSFVPLLFGVGILLLGLYPSATLIPFSWEHRIPPGLESWERSFFTSPNMRKSEIEQTIKHIEADAIVFTDWDQVYSFYYVAHILQGHTEMDFHETFPQDGVTRLAESAISYIDANIVTRPIYFSEQLPALASRYKMTRAGSHLFRIERK